MNQSTRVLAAGIILSMIGLVLWLLRVGWLLAALTACIGVALLMGWAFAAVRRNLTVPGAPDERLH